MSDVLSGMLMLAEQVGSSGAAAAPSTDPTGGIMGMLLMFGPLLLIFYLLIIRPESKKQKQRETLLAALKTKDKVVTIGGVFGEVVEIDAAEGSVTLLVDKKKDVRIKYRRSSIDTVERAEEKAEKK